MVKLGAASLSVALFACLQVALPATVAVAQSPAAGSWIIGIWEGAHSRRDIRSDSVTFTFMDSNGSISWMMKRQTYSDRSGSIELEASGTVLKMNDAAIEMEGRYEQSTNHRDIGQSVKYWLTRKGDSLEGTFVGSSGQTTHVSLKRKE